MAKQQELKQIVIPPINTQRVTLRVVGDSPYIAHAWSQKSIDAIASKQEGKAKQKQNVTRDPNREFLDCLYWLNKEGQKIAPKDSIDKHKDGFGIPSIAFKKSIRKAANDAGVHMTVIDRAIFIQGPMTRIKHKKAPRIVADTIRLPNKSGGITYRAYFDEWEALIAVDYNANLISAEQVANIVNLAGFGVGIGDWRPEKQGCMGRYHVA